MGWRRLPWLGCTATKRCTSTERWAVRRLRIVPRYGFLCLLAILLLQSAPAYARDVVNAALRVPFIDLIQVMEKVESTERTVSIMVPQGKGPETLMTLQAKGPGAISRWAVVSVLNPDPVPHDLVLVIPHQGFAGSGLFWPRQQGSRIFSLQHSGQTVISALRSSGADAYAFRIDAGAAETFAFEMTDAGVQSVLLHQRTAYDADTGKNLFNGGLLIGIAALVMGGMVSMMAVRFRLSLLAGTLFATGGFMFITAQIGYLPGMAGIILSNPAYAPRFAVVSEALLAAGLALLILSLIDLRHSYSWIRHGLIVTVSMIAALAAYGLFAPIFALAGLRLLLVVVGASGFALALLRFVARPASGLMPLILFPALFLWAVMAMVVAVGSPSSDLGAGLPGTLAFLNLGIGLALLQPLIGSGFGLARFEDSGRRALALAGAGQTVWDWHADRGVLHVGPELERVLGLDAGTLTRNGNEGFISQIHPSDRGAYLAAVESSEARGRGNFTQRFRLKRRDGSYRWFLLRARAMPGSSGKAARLIGALADVTDQRQSEERLLTDAVHDRVTGLPNQPILIDRLESALRRSDTRNGLHLLVIDIDRFKAVNEGLGHETGDSLLAVTGRRLQALISPEDTLARLHGDQFAILLDVNRPSRSISVFIDGLRRAISRPVALKPREVFLTVSIGVVAITDPERDASSLLKDAEIALYEAKRRGKDQVEYFRIDMGDERSELVSLEQDLRLALQRKEIEVLYQPICKLRSQELAGFEALIRWHHRIAGEILPERFLPVAEATGLIRELGNFVLNEAGRQLGAWQRSYRSDPPLFVSVNVSSSQLLSNELVEEFSTLMAREDLPPGSLRIEITEAVVMQNPELSAELLVRLKGLGAGIACDDFGTGYSALGMLRRLPFDTLKIDRSFVAADESDERASVILETIVRLAHDLGMTSVAEGIELREQKDRLAQLRCDLGQGYYFGEPMPARKVGEKLRGSGDFRSRSSRLANYAWKKILGLDGKREVSPVAAPEPKPASISPPLPRDPAPEPGLKRVRPAVRAPLVGPKLPEPGKTPLAQPLPVPATRVRPTAPRDPVDQQSTNDLLVAFKAMLARNNAAKGDEN